MRPLAFILAVIGCLLLSGSPEAVAFLIVAAVLVLVARDKRG
jgi:hypothetical protein